MFVLKDNKSISICDLFRVIFFGGIYVCQKGISSFIYVISFICK